MRTHWVTVSSNRKRPLTEISGGVGGGQPPEQLQDKMQVMGESRQKKSNRKSREGVCLTPILLLETLGTKRKPASHCKVTQCCETLKMGRHHHSGLSAQVREGKE